MASYCMLCAKKLGFFSAIEDDVLTGKSGNKLCEDCFRKAETIVKKIETKVPFEKEDLEGFSEDGEKIVREYLEIYGISDPLSGEISDEDFEEEIRPLEVGDAVTTKLYEVDEEETNAIFEKMKEMSGKEIESFLEGIVSENDTADSFMREVLSLNDENLAAVLSEQRELYNNAEWAYILLVDYMRKAIDEAVQKPEEEIPEDDEPIDEAETERMKKQFSNLDRQELEKIITDKSYTKEARKAAEELLQD